MAEEVWRWLTDGVGTIGIYGIGGVGKTTLLKQIYNKLLTTSPHNFDTVIWVTVSQNLSVEKIQDDIWKKIGVFNLEWVDKSFQQKSLAIGDVLSQTKFVLLLDDLGQQLELLKLGVPHPHPTNCKAIIFTTRSEEVCRDMGAEAILPIKPLGSENAWDLFKNKVGEHKLVDPKIRSLARLVAITCKGIPMLLCTVGRAMAKRTTHDGWLGATKHLQTAAKRDQEYVFQLLNFCLDTLDVEAKSCLLFYSLFPEDFTILKNELIDFWICNQLLGHDDTKADVLNLGYKTIDTLIGACLLEEELVNYVKLQDLIRDSALQLETKPIMFRTAELENMEAVWALAMRHSFENMAFVSTYFVNFFLKHNPFIVVQDLTSIMSVNEFMNISAYLMPSSKFVFLSFTVLDLSNTGVVEIPREIEKLVFLEYLNLSNTWIEYLPMEMKMLVKLKCLNMEYTEQLRVIPKQVISSLFSLQVLKMFRCGFSVEEIEDNIMSLRYMDIGPISRLEHLKVLSVTITCVQALHSFFSNPKLLNCTQSLSLEVFWGCKSLDISPVATMKNLLTLEIHQTGDLDKFNGFPHSFELIRGRSFEKLREITVEKCSRLRELTWVILVPNLTILMVKNCEEMEEIINTRRMGEIFVNGQDLEPFAKLEILVLNNLPELKSVCSKVLPLLRLKKVEVTDCCLLKKLPLTSNSSKVNELIIEAEEEWWADIEWEDDITKDTFVPCFKPALD